MEWQRGDVVFSKQLTSKPKQTSMTPKKIWPLLLGALLPLLVAAQPAVQLTDLLQFHNSAGSFRRPVSDLLLPQQEGIEDIVGGMVTGNTETGITVTYNDGTGKLDFVVAAASAEYLLAATRADLASSSMTNGIAMLTDTDAGGLFYAVTSGATVNGGTVLQGGGSTKWVRMLPVNGQIDPKWWRGDGSNSTVTTDAAAVLAAYNFARSSPKYNFGLAPNKTYYYGSNDSTIFSSVGRDFYIYGNNATVVIGETSAAWVFDNAQRFFIQDVRFVGNVTATATATISGGQVTGFTITNGGWYETAPTVTISGSATATAILTNGQVTGFNITNPGSGYSTPPTVTLTTPTRSKFPTPAKEGTAMRFNGSNCGDIYIENCRFTQFGAYAIDILSTAGSTGYYKGLTVSNCFFYEAPMDISSHKQFCIKASNGTEYHIFQNCEFEKVPRIYWGASNGANTWFNDCQAANTYAQQQRNNAQIGTVTVVGGAIQHIALSNAGAGYETAPTVNITGGTGATATAVIEGGQVVGITVTDGGSGYSTATVSVTLTGAFGEVVGLFYLENRATLPKARAVIGDGVVTAIYVDYPGVGYAGTPTVTLSGGGFSTQATATAQMSNGRLIGFNITSGGSGYATAPTVSFSGGSSGANFGKFQLNGGKYNHVEHGASGDDELGGSPLAVMLGVDAVPSQNRQFIWTGVEALVVGNNSGANNNSAVFIAKNAYVQMVGGGIQGKSTNGACVRLVNVDSAVISNIYILNGTHAVEAKDCAGLRIDWQTIWVKDQSGVPFNFTGTTTNREVWLKKIYISGVNGSAFTGDGSQGNPLGINITAFADEVTITGDGSAGNKFTLMPRDYPPMPFPLAGRSVQFTADSKDNLADFGYIVPEDLNNVYLERLDWFVLAAGTDPESGDRNICKIRVIYPGFDPNAEIARAVLGTNKRAKADQICLQVKTGMEIQFFMDSVQLDGVPPKGWGVHLTFSPQSCQPGTGNLLPTTQYSAILQRANNLGVGLPTYSEQVSQNQLTQQLVADGLWAKLDGLYIMTRGSQGFALINWIQPGTGDGIINSGSSITWTNLEGFTNSGGSSSYITLLDPDQATNYTTDAASVGLFAFPLSSGDNAARTLSSSGSPRVRMAMTSGIANVMNANNAGPGSVDFSGTGIMTMVRTTSTQVKFYKNSTLLTTSDGNPTTGVSGEALDIRLWGDTTTWNGRVKAVFIGGLLTGDEITTLVSRLTGI